MKLRKSKALFHPPNKNNKKFNEFDKINTTFSGNYIYDKTRNTKKSSREKEQNIFSQNISNDRSFNNLENLTIQKIKKNRNKDKSRSSKLTPAKYIKPLYYMLNDRVKAINKQFSGFKYERYYINLTNNFYPSSKNDENYTKQKGGNIDYSVYDIYIKNMRKNNKNKRKKNQNCSFDDKFKNGRIKISYINYSQDDINNLNFKVNLIQACFRSFIRRYKFYKNLRDKIKDGNYSEKIIRKTNNYFNTLNSIKKGNTNLKSSNKENNFNVYKSTKYNNNLVEYKNDNFTIKSKINKKNRKSSINSKNYYLIKKKNENYEKEKEIYLKEKMMFEQKIKELTEENKKLKNNITFYEKNKSNNEKLKNENQKLKERIAQLEQRDKEREIMEIKYKNLVSQNETLFQDNLNLNEQIKNKIEKLVELNKKNQEKIKLYEDVMSEQESILSENNKLNKLNKEMTDKMNQLIKENNEYKEKLKEKDEIIQNNKNKNQENLKNIDSKNNDLKQENEDLISENKKINAKNEELQKLVEEMKKKISTISKAKKFMNKSLKDNDKNDINNQNELDEEDNKINEEDEEDDNNNNNHELYLQRVRNRDLTLMDKEKEERLKRLFKNKILEMKDYLHRAFMRFYYNGIFVQLQKRKSIEINNNSKVVKSKRFSALVDKFNSPSNSLGKADSKIKRVKTQSNEDKLNTYKNLLNSSNTIYEDKEE